MDDKALAPPPITTTEGHWQDAKEEWGGQMGQAGRPPPLGYDWAAEEAEQRLIRNNPESPLRPRGSGELRDGFPVTGRETRIS